MDDQNNREYSRAPEFEDFLKLCESLNESGVKYIVIGGFAVMLHGFARNTKDIDLLVDSSEVNIRKVKEAMSILPDNAISLIEDDEVQKYQVVRVGDEFVVDLMARACGISYFDAEEEIEWIEIESVKIPIPTKELLIRMKDTVRPSDKMDVDFLRNKIEVEKEK